MSRSPPVNPAVRPPARASHRRPGPALLRLRPLPPRRLPHRLRAPKPQDNLPLPCNRPLPGNPPHPDNLRPPGKPPPLADPRPPGNLPPPVSSRPLPQARQPPLRQRPRRPPLSRRVVHSLRLPRPPATRHRPDFLPPARPPRSLPTVPTGFQPHRTRPIPPSRPATAMSRMTCCRNPGACPDCRPHSCAARATCW